MAPISDWLNISRRLILLLLLLISGISPNPGPPPPNRRNRPPPTPPTPPRILQINVNGIQTSRRELSAFLHENNVKVACVQETKLRPNTADPSFPGYALLRRDRPGGGGGGLAFLISHDVEFSPIDVTDVIGADPHLELQAINLHLRHVSFAVYNVYIPPNSSCAPGYRPDFERFLDDVAGDSVIVGDFNAHSDSWFSSLNDLRGDSLAEAVEGSEYAFMNTDHATRLSNNGSSSPDVSIVSAHIADTISWAVPHVVDGSFSSTILNSDHLPILLSFVDPFHQQEFNSNIRTRRSFVNLRRADWEKFTSDLETFIPQSPPVSCSKGEKIFRNAVLKAARRNIPAGYRRDFVPNLPPEAVPIRNRRDALRASNPGHPDLPDLERQLRQVCDIAVHDKQDTEYQTNSPKFTNLVRRLSGKRIYRPPNQPISFLGKVHTKRAAIAKKFNKQFSSIGDHKHLPITRKVLRRIRKKRLVPDFSPFNDDDVIAAIRRAKASTAAGPDGVTMVHLKHLGRRAISYLTSLFNLSVRNSELPSIWKQGSHSSSP